MKELTKIGRNYATDKASLHNFTELYDNELSHLRNKNIKLLEIGIDKGFSLKMWKEYFPNAMIYGADIFDKSCYSEDRILIQRCNQEKPETLKNLFKGEIFDIVIDDGGHTMLQQQLTLLHMLPRIKSGGKFIMEDLHTSSSLYKLHNPTNIKTTFELLTQTKQSFDHTKSHTSIEGYAISPADVETINSFIDNIIIWFNSKSTSVTSILTVK